MTFKFDRKSTRKALAYGFWGCIPLGIALTAFNAVRFGDVPGYSDGAFMRALAMALIYGALGYLFFAGFLIQDKDK